MARDLTNSDIDRQNILNNEMHQMRYEAMQILRVVFEGKETFTKEMIAEFYDVDIRTIGRYTAKFSDELKSKGYDILKGKRPKQFFEELSKQHAPDIDVGKNVLMQLWNKGEQHVLQF